MAKLDTIRHAKTMFEQDAIPRCVVWGRGSDGETGYHITRTSWTDRSDVIIWDTDRAETESALPPKWWDLPEEMR